MEKVISNYELVNMLKSGQDSAYDYLYQQYYGRLCAFSSQFVTIWEAENIVHETMMWIWENRSSLIPDLNIKSFLFAIVKNKSLNQARHNKIRCEVLEDIKYKFSQRFDAPDFYVYEELKENFRKALAKLPTEYRDAFIMNRFEGMTYKEIAKKKHVSTKTVAYRIGKALKILCVELQDYMKILVLIHFLL